MNSKLYTAALALLGFAFSLTAPFISPLALLFTDRNAKSLPASFSWYDTPDEPELIGLYEHQVKWLYDHFGWFVAAWHWFGFRNRGHGFASAVLSQEAPASGKYGSDGAFFYQRQWLVFRVVFGWQIYRSTRYASKFEYRPKIALKIRRPGSLSEADMNRGSA